MPEEELEVGFGAFQSCIGLHSVRFPKRFGDGEEEEIDLFLIMLSKTFFVLRIVMKIKIISDACFFVNSPYLCIILLLQDKNNSLITCLVGFLDGLSVERRAVRSYWGEEK